MYEHPLVERVRTMLRIEDLFARAETFIRRSSPADHQVALLTLFEILEVVSRPELKSDLLQELERQRQSMQAYRSSANADQHVLGQVLEEMDHSSTALLAMTGKVGQYLRDDEWLMSVRQRAGIPGGLCKFDLPSFHHWLNREDSVRIQALRRWISPLYPVRDGARLMLVLLRESGRPQHALATQGAYQQMLGGRVSQLVRIWLPLGLDVVPEVSANKYALNIRFMFQGEDARPRVSEQDIPFELTFCNL